MALLTTEYLKSLVRELVKLPSETEWVEFKCNNKDPQQIGEYISALSNSATLCERPKGYLVWGIQNETHDIEGTTFSYQTSKKGNEELEAWLARMCSPRINFRFYDVYIDDSTKVVLIEIPCAEKQPVNFSGTEYIRVGSNKKKLKDYPEKERLLWQAFDTTLPELRFSAENKSAEEIITLLDYPRYYEKLDRPIPNTQKQVLRDFEDEKFIHKNDAGSWDITNYGALMIAKDLKRFDSLSRRAVRVIWYKDTSRLETVREHVFSSGYAISYDTIIEYVMTIIPQKEIIEDGMRRQEISFPEIAIRELLANIMIHQSLLQRGTSPMIEVFSDRIEFSNPGAPLVDIERIIDTVPLSRNENIAGFMHRCGICEERGSGYDKILEATCANELLAPRIENQNNQFTKVVLFSKVPFNLIPREDRIRTCYMQACLAYVQYGTISNSDVRKVFGLSDKQMYIASRIIKDTLDAGLIKPLDEKTAPRYMRYVPYWA